MTNSVVESIDKKLEARGLRSVEEFSTSAIAFTARHSKNPEVFARHMADWENSNYDSMILGQNIRTILEFKRNELAKRQFRSDWPKELLSQMVADIKDRVVEDYVDHLEEVITAHELVEWCEVYLDIMATPTT